ncbi:unnamed protein product [Ixodes persulcatus]
MTEAAEGTAPVTEDVELADVGLLVKYLRRVVPVLLEEDDVVHPSLESALSDKGNLEILRKFIADPQTRSLLIQRSSSKDEELVGEGGGDGEEENVVYTFSSEVHFTNPKINSLVVIKKCAVIEADKKVPSQLRVMNLNDSSPYETLHSYVSSAVAPYFKSYVKETGRAERDGDKMAPTVEKKIAELEMGLLHLQQNIDIPEITLPINPLVLATIKKCAEEGRRATAADFGDRVEDSSFLNQLQNGVNRWIREIQKVTKLDRDPSSGTALQEISFWLNLERALLRIQEKRESLEVALTLDILKKGKRFHATVSFDTDTGLKQALSTVNDYNPLMKDFPLNDLLAATELDRIRLALHGIFSHLRKIRSTKYPIQRALRLVEAISRDLMGQLLKVPPSSPRPFFPPVDGSFEQHSCSPFALCRDCACSKPTVTVQSNPASTNTASTNTASTNTASTKVPVQRIFFGSPSTFHRSQCIKILTTAYTVFCAIPLERNKSRVEPPETATNNWNPRNPTATGAFYSAQTDTKRWRVCSEVPTHIIVNVERRSVELADRPHAGMTSALTGWRPASRAG